jgi:invasion protein IalB
MVEVVRGSAVIVCAHVANGAPVLLAMRTKPQGEYDSGWQLLCNCHEENWEDAKVCSVSEALDLEPSLKGFIDLPPDVTIIRDDVSSAWKKV